MRAILRPGTRVRIGQYGPSGTVETMTIQGLAIVHFDSGLTCTSHPYELDVLEPPPDASPEEARRLLADLHAITQADTGPIADVPYYSLTAPVQAPARGRQSRLRFEE